MSLGLFPESIYGYQGFGAILASYRGGKPVQIGYNFQAANGTGEWFWLSPSGRELLLRMPIEMLPGATSVVVTKPDPVSALNTTFRVSKGFRLVALDLATNGTKVLSGLGSYRNRLETFQERAVATTALWAPDSRHVMVASTAAPLGKDREARGKIINLVEYDTGTGNGRVIATFPIDVAGETMTTYLSLALSWAVPGTVLNVSVRAGGTQTVSDLQYQLSRGRWVANLSPKVTDADSTNSEAKVVAGGLNVVLRESANEPPALWAIDRGREIRLTPADPTLKNVAIAPTEAIQWNDESGRTFDGGLILPPNASERHNLPLVIQLIPKFSPKRFLPDGADFSAVFAAQPLAANGMAVLQFDTSSPGIAVSTPQEGPAAVSGLESAVEYLDRKGLIDKSRVGLVGHSRTCALLGVAITNYKKANYAAAVCNEGEPLGYWSYIVNFGLLSFDPAQQEMYRQAYNRFYAADETLDFWKNKQAWMERAPAFNVDRVQTPLLIGTTRSSYISILDFYLGLKMLGRPVDIFNLPDGNHSPQRPRERLISQQSTVDWMKFWLLGDERGDAATRERIERWKQMKSIWKAKDAVKAGD